MLMTWFRLISLNVLAVVLAAAAGVGACHILHLSPHLNEMVTAGTIIGIGSIVAILPLLMFRNSNPAVVAQAALSATVIHLLWCAAAILAGSALLHQSHLNLYWLCAFYVATLITVAKSCIGTLRNATAVLNQPR